MYCQSLTSTPTELIPNWEAGAYSPLTNTMYMPLRNVCARMLATTEGEDTNIYALVWRGQIVPGTDQVGRVQAISAETGETVRAGAAWVPGGMEDRERANTDYRLAVRQRRHQVLDLARRAGDVGPRFAEVDLHRRAGKHAAVHEGLLRRYRRPQRRDVAAHRARGDRSGQRQQQPANPFGARPPVLAQPLLDLLPPRVQAAGPRRRHPHWRRLLGYGAANRLDVQLQPPGDLLLRHTLHQMQVADLGPLRHPDHLRVLLAASATRPCRAA